MVSMKDVAARAGVSQSTVSFVLNSRKRDDGSISEETRQRVLQTAAELGYRRNELSRAVVSGKNRMIGFITSARSLEFQARMTNGVLDETQARDYTVKIVRVADVETGRRHIERCVELRMAGVISLQPPGDVLHHLRAELRAANIPLMVLDSDIDYPGDWSVRSDHLEGTRQAMEHLMKLGHRRIAYLGGDTTSLPSLQRGEGYCIAMDRHQLPVPEGYVAWTGYYNELTMRATRELMSHPAGRPTAILCASDTIAMIVLRTVRQLGLRVPEDVSVVGYGDWNMASFSDPALTTVMMDFEEMGRVAARHLLDYIERREKASGPSGIGNTMLTPRLFVRASTGPAPE